MANLTLTTEIAEKLNYFVHSQNLLLHFIRQYSALDVWTPEDFEKVDYAINQIEWNKFDTIPEIYCEDWCPKWMGTWIVNEMATNDLPEDDPRSLISDIHDYKWIVDQFVTQDQKDVTKILSNIA